MITTRLEKYLDSNTIKDLIKQAVNAPNESRIEFKTDIELGDNGKPVDTRLRGATVSWPYDDNTRPPTSGELTLNAIMMKSTDERLDDTVTITVTHKVVDDFLGRDRTRHYRAERVIRKTFEAAIAGGKPETDE